MTPYESLAAVLAAHPCADAAEAADRAAMLRLLRETEHPFSALQFAPGHFTASALIVSPATQQMLLVFHAKLRRWLQPGGHMEPGETDPRVAACREALEETGLTVAPGATPIDLDVHQIPARGDQPAHLHFDVRYLCRCADTTPPHAAEAHELRWCGTSELPSLDLDPGLVRMIGKALRGAA